MDGIDKKGYVEVKKESIMKKMTFEEIKQAQIGILDYFSSFCEKNGLNYTITYGTLLGAIRHKGFIPWDDDIDVAMLREDYDKLILLTQAQQDSRYRFSCVENDKDCMYPFGKMIDEKTILYESGEEGIKIGVYIDVFVYDDAPDDKRKCDEAYKMLEKYARWRKYQLPMKRDQFSIKRLIVMCIRGIFKFFLPRQYFTRKIVTSAKQCRNIDGVFVCDLTDPYFHKKWSIEKSVFKDLIDVQFEGKNYKAIREYDRFLTMQYGDYMKIPSKEQQEAMKHEIVAYYKD